MSDKVGGTAVIKENPCKNPIKRCISWIISTWNKLFPKTKITDVTKENDIKYNGPLSYRMVRIFGWIAMVLAQCAIVVSCAASIWSASKPDSIGVINNLTNVSYILAYFQLLPLPLFLLANFAIILQNHKNPLKILKTYVIFTVAFGVIYIFVLEHYLITGLANVVFAKTADPRGEAIKAIEGFLSKKFSQGLSLNVFVDMLICTLMYVFAYYVPKNGFKSDTRRIIFRSLIVLPILYEIASFVLKSLNGKGTITLPVYLYPIMTNKPFIMFIAFMCLILFIVIRGHIFKKRGKTKEEYEDYLLTNSNSFHFSLFTSGVFIVFGLLDLVLTYFDLKVFNSSLEAFGIGDSTCLLFVIPFVLLFSYTKTHKNSTIDKFLPIIGIGLVVLTYVEGFFQILLCIANM